MATYTHGHHDSVLRSHRWRTAENSAAYLLGDLEPHARVLDVGCGPGTITADLAALVPHGSVTGLEAAPEVLEQARAAAAQRGVDNVEFTEGDVHALPFDDDTFDVVHAHQVLQHVTDPVQALREMKRVCRPGGTVAARDADYAAMAWHPRLPELDDWLDLYRSVARGNGGEPDAGRLLLGWARKAGLPDVRPSASAWCFATPDERAWWSGMWAERTTSSRYARTAVDAGLADPAGLERIAAAWQAWGEQPDGWFAVLHGEIRCRV
jgi:SAM-dependent methyltransferase